MNPGSSFTPSLSISSSKFVGSEQISHNCGLVNDHARQRTPSVAVTTEIFLIRVRIIVQIFSQLGFQNKKARDANATRAVHL